MKHSKRVCAVLLATATALFATNTLAVDGVILIDQNKALAGNVTPGDTANFPVTISQPGSYRLSSNLTVPSGQSGIVITVPNVTIDLNGFGITSSVQGPGSGAFGIIYSGTVPPRNITIVNGVIEGFPTIVLFSQDTGCQFCTLENLTLRWGFPGGAASLDLGNFTRIHRMTGPDTFINVKCPSVVTNSAVRAVSISILFPGDPVPNQGTCTFAHNATIVP
jgi:hypothetical protein